MVGVREKKRSAASDGEDAGEEAKRRGSARAASSSNGTMASIPAVAGNKAAAPQKAMASIPAVAGKKASASQNAVAGTAIVVAAHKGTDKPSPIGQYNNFEIQMQLIEGGKRSKAASPIVASPVKFGSPGRSKCNKVWVAGLKSGELVAYVTDRYRPENPAFIKNGLDRWRDDPVLCENCKVSAIIHKKADKQPFKAWAEAKVSATTQTSYTLYWNVLVRRFKDVSDHTPEAHITWGGSLAKYFEVTERGNKFEYGGDLSMDQACPASDFFKVQDVMEMFILKRVAGIMVESEIVRNSHLMASYYGDDPVLNSQVKQFYTPNEQQAEEAVDQEDAKLNKELSGLF